MDVGQHIVTLTDIGRKKLFHICSDLIGEDITTKLVNESNSEFGGRYVSVGGIPLKLASSGTRLLIAMVAACLDEKISNLIVDEPEIGLSPRAQSAFANFLYDKRKRKEFFPHLSQIFISTHSHLFLDRKNIRNNFIVSKHNGLVCINQVKDAEHYDNLLFNMLGNSLEDLFLPSAIVLTEGISDQKFLSHLLKIHLPNVSIAVVHAGGESEILKSVQILGQALGHRINNPYKYRFFAVFDQKHSANDKIFRRSQIKMENVTIWSKNGIEYFYPREVMSEIYGCGTDYNSDEIKLDGIRNHVEFMGNTMTKDQLAIEVCRITTEHHHLDKELADFIEMLKSKLS